MSLDPGGVAARPVEAGNEANFHRVSANDEDDGNRRRRCFGCKRSRGADRCDDDSHPPANQVRREIRQALVVTFAPAIFDGDILTFDVTGFAQTLAERGHEISKRRSRCAMQ
jgi:hypothetical protein